MTYSMTKKALAAGALAMALMGSTSALAQNCTPMPLNPGGGFPVFTNVLAGMASGLAAANAISATVNATNTAFLTQSSAFVSAPGGAEPNAQNGGAWVRAVGGGINVKSNSTVGATVTSAALPGGSGVSGCRSQVNQTFTGVQFGQDLARLNLEGFNVHLGVTAGMIETKGHVANGNLQGGTFNTATQAPFAGSYLVVTRGGFFADAMLRYNYYSTRMDSPTANVFNQKIDSHGVTIAASAGYRWTFPDSNWFLEPSAGVVWSNTKVDPFNTSNPVTGSPGFGPGNFQGTTRVSDMTSTIGRVGLRVGTVFEASNIVWQPFVAVSVWNEFGPEVKATYANCFGCMFYGAAPALLAANVTSQNIGTYGQYSVGVSGQILNTGWLGFARLDYRSGNRMEGLSGTGGIRYQFSPEAPNARGGVFKGPAVVASSPAVNWSGLYLGGFGGAAYGEADIGFPMIGQTTKPRFAGLMLGGTLGYNHQIGNFVVGVEGDFGWTNATGTGPCSGLIAPAAGISTLFQMNCREQADWIGTVAGRVGYASGRTLYYVKAGAAITHDTFTMSCNNGPTNAGNPLPQQCSNAASLLSNGSTASGTRLGWTVGYGTEFALNQNWSVKGELDYADFGKRRITTSDASVIDVNVRTLKTKVGVNYRFNFGGPDAVVARY